MTTETLLIVAGFWIVCGIASLLIAQSRGLNPTSAFLGGIILGPLGIVLALVTTPAETVAFAQAGTVETGQPNGMRLLGMFGVIIVAIIVWTVATQL